MYSYCWQKDGSLSAHSVAGGRVTVRGFNVDTERCVFPLPRESAAGQEHSFTSLSCSPLFRYIVMKRPVTPSHSNSRFCRSKAAVNTSQPIVLSLPHLQATRSSQAFQSQRSTALKGPRAPYYVSLVSTGDLGKLSLRSVL